MLYLAVIHKDSGSEYGVSFPDFPGCVTAGKTIDEAKDMAGEALALHIQGMFEDGEDLPEPTILEDALQNTAYAEAVYMMVAAPPIASSAVRINISLPEQVLHGIDRVAKKHHMNRSKFLAQAAIQYAATLEGSVPSLPQKKGKQTGSASAGDAFPSKPVIDKEWHEQSASDRSHKIVIKTSDPNKRRASSAAASLKPISKIPK